MAINRTIAIDSLVDERLIGMQLYLSRREQVVIAVLLLAMLGALLCMSYAYGKQERAAKAAVPLFERGAASAPAGETSQRSASVVVHVCGAVQRPGVYQFAPGARVLDAIHEAGGARPDGCLDAHNLAARLQDEQKIYVPTKDEWQRQQANAAPPLIETGAAPAAAPLTGAAKPTSTAKPAAASPHEAAPRGPKPLPQATINLNTATQEQLMTLPGVGEVTAQHILEYRAQHGKFTDVAQLLDIPRIGPKTLEKISPHISL